MSEQIEACACGNSEIMHQAISWRSIYFCHVCLRGGKGEATLAAAKQAWNADMKAIKAARDVEPKPPKRPRVCTGEWRVSPSRNLIHEEIVADSEGQLITIARISGHHDLLATARLMAAAKEMHRKLAEGRALYRDGYSSTSLSEFFCKVGAFLDGLGVDVD